MIKRYLKELLRKTLWAKSGYCKPSYAQEGEDRILAVLLDLAGREKPGFYVDVGAHDPQRYSNTFLFYGHGWRGINIDATPGSMRSFRRERSRDINVEAAVAEGRKVMTFYEFNEPLLNGFSREIALARNNYHGWEIVNQREIRTVTLEQVLEAHLPEGCDIEFLNVDVEGLDLEVLKSNNWDRFRPAIVLVEDSEELLNEGDGETEICRYMRDKNYRLCCKTLLTTFFLDDNKVERTPVGYRLKPVSRSLGAD
jgi:FkbM family methyltransferase